MSATQRRTYHVGGGTIPDAVEQAKARARLEGYVFVTLARVAPNGPGWDVTLIVRGRAA